VTNRELFSLLARAGHLPQELTEPLRNMSASTARVGVRRLNA
jgi:hypothetical protein